MLEVLVYLFETYYAADEAPNQAALERKLTDAGFPNDDIADALDWLRELAEPEQTIVDQRAGTNIDAARGTRIYSRTETARLALEARGFLMFLESAGILTPTLREIVIDRALAIDTDSVTLDQLKVIVLIVLWTRQGSLDTLVLEELLPNGEPRNIH